MVDDGTPWGAAASSPAEPNTNDGEAAANHGPSPAPMTRRELRRLREAQEAIQEPLLTAVPPPPELPPTSALTLPAEDLPAEDLPAEDPLATQPQPVTQPQQVAPPQPVAPPSPAAPPPLPTLPPPLPTLPPPAPSEQTEQPAGFVKAPNGTSPHRGFRGWLYRVTGGAFNLGPTPAERDDAELDRRIRRRLAGSRNTVFLSLKGGVGKTSTTVGVGLTLASIRSGSVCAIDANPDAGDLIERALGEGAYESERELTITRLVQELGDSDSRVALDGYLHQAGSLRLLAGEQDPDLSDSLRADDYRRVCELISRHYSVTLTDCGTGVTRLAMRGILETADNVVVATGFAVSGAKRARDTLAWLAGHGFGDLARNAIVVIADKDDVSARVDKAAIETTLAGMCRALISVPHDKAVADGDLVSLEALRPETRRAYKELAAAIVDGYL